MLSAFNLLHILLCSSVFLKHLTIADQEANQFIYHGFNGANLRLNGIAEILPNGLLELTNISFQQIGHAFFPFPLKFSKSSSINSQSFSFSTNFVFAIVPQLPDLGGHGIAFTISPSLEFTGAWAIGFLGLFNSTDNGLSSNHVFAVELDTIFTPEFNDINNNHVGIDVNGLTSNVSAPVAYFPDNERKNKSLELISGNPMQVWIDYDDVEKLLNVTVAPVISKKPGKPLLSTNIDLSLVLLDSMYVGFSSSTGSMASYHYILGWSFNRSGPSQSLDASKLPSLPPKRESSKKPDLRIMVPSITASVVLIIISGSAIYRRKRFEELGELPSSNTQVAVKKVSHDSQQGIKEFVAEIVSMGRLRHRNLVQLLGYCRRKGELLLVYDYMPNGSLDKLLFHNDTPNLNWVRRYQILRGVASALLYLHEEWEQVVLHRDVKASNVMLDADLNGRLRDFGLAKFYDHGSIPQTTCVV
ncbi:hypothetical protein GH714_027183 [Hevea brasiliensis]|uniref:Protein kinase domain-containing protein n=1 Tax=Hevea brasiliensis TaxID=3981 RepID=A0A6A6MDX9_HEVBR|nr:hypothetical protein GH714_027183 [Hevea brasiliensis]